MEIVQTDSQNLYVEPREYIQPIILPISKYRSHSADSGYKATEERQGRAGVDSLAKKIH